MTILANDSRGQKALALVSSGALEQPVWLDQSLSQRLVPSCTKEGAFYVTDATSCTCPDAKYRRAVCKHQQAVRLANVLKLAEQENQQEQPHKYANEHQVDEAYEAARADLMHGIIPAHLIERES